jgi:hypothetical protein
MKLSELSVRRPVLITMVYVIIMVICAMFISNLQISLYPSVSMPIISVMVDCNEAGPEEIEQQVAKVLENNLGSLENLNTISSTSSEGQAFVTLEFNYGTDLDDAEDDVQSEINTLVGRDSFPDWADTPTIFRFDRMNNSSFMRLVMSGSSDLDQLKEIAEDDVSPMLLRVSGVSQVEVMGTGTKKYEVKVDPIKLAAYDLTLTNVKTALANANINDTQGTITQDSMNYTISMDERFMNLDDIRQTVVSTIDGADITVDDIATVESAHSTGQERYLDGNQVINLSVSNDSDANSTTVAKAVRAALPEINASLPDGVKVTIQRDETTLISSTLNEVYANAIRRYSACRLVHLPVPSQHQGDADHLPFHADLHSDHPDGHVHGGHHRQQHVDERFDPRHRHDRRRVHHHSGEHVQLPGTGQQPCRVGNSRLGEHDHRHHGVHVDDDLCLRAADHLQEQTGNDRHHVPGSDLDGHHIAARLNVRRLHAGSGVKRLHPEAEHPCAETIEIPPAPLDG